MYVVLGSIAFFVMPAENFLFGMAGRKLIERIRSSTFKSVVHQEINWFDDPKNSSGSISARLSTDAVNVKKLVGDNLALNVQTLATVIAGFLVAIIANWKLTLIILVVIPLVDLQGYFQVQFLKGFSANAKKMYEDASQIANGAVSGIRTVFFALVLSTTGVARTSAMGSNTTKAKDSTNSIFDILDRKSKIDSSNKEDIVLKNVRGESEDNNVYNSEDLSLD